MIPSHTTGHVFAPNGSLCRVDVIAGRWVASMFSADRVVIHQVFGTDEQVHRQVERWLTHPAVQQVPI